MSSSHSCLSWSFLRCLDSRRKSARSQLHWKVVLSVILCIAELSRIFPLSARVWARYCPRVSSTNYLWMTRCQSLWCHSRSSAALFVQQLSLFRSWAEIVCSRRNWPSRMRDHSCLFLEVDCCCCHHVCGCHLLYVLILGSPFSAMVFETQTFQ